jgi:hypothetical protein
MKHLTAIGALILVSCTGSVEDGKNPTGDPGGMEQPGPGPGIETLDPAKAPFAVKQGTPELVPFKVRVRRIASALNVQPNHPMFAEMWANAVQLGDYDHANGALPDGLWIGSRIALWMDALKPVCASTEMKTLYPNLPGDMNALIRNAWGRLPAAEDVADLTTPITESGVDAATAYESTCMAVFSAAEFVYR